MPFRAAACALLFAVSAPASAGELPADHAAVLLARALAYDANLTKRAGPTVDITVLYRAAADAPAATKLTAAFNGLSDLKILGLPMHATTTAYTTDGLAQALAAGTDELFLVGAFTPAELSAIRGVCDGAHALTLAGSRGLAELGAAVAVDMDQGKPTIFVNLESSKAASAELGAGLLRLAVLIKGNR